MLGCINSACFDHLYEIALVEQSFSLMLYEARCTTISPSSFFCFGCVFRSFIVFLLFFFWRLKKVRFCLSTVPCQRQRCSCHRFLIPHVSDKVRIKAATSSAQLPHTYMNLAAILTQYLAYTYGVSSHTRIVDEADMKQQGDSCRNIACWTRSHARRLLRRCLECESAIWKIGTIYKDIFRTFDAGARGLGTHEKILWGFSGVIDEYTYHNIEFDNSHFLFSDRSRYRYESTLDHSNQKFRVIPDPGYDCSRIGKVLLPSPAQWQGRRFSEKSNLHKVGHWWRDLPLTNTVPSSGHAPYPSNRACNLQLESNSSMRTENKTIHAAARLHLRLWFVSLCIPRYADRQTWLFPFFFLPLCLYLPYHAFLVFPLIRVYPRHERLGYSHVKVWPMRWRGLRGVRYTA